MRLSQLLQKTVEQTECATISFISLVSASMLWYCLAFVIKWTDGKLVYYLVLRGVR